MDASRSGEVPRGSTTRWLGTAVAAGREGLKRATRWTGEASAGLRTLPDFLIVGAKRGGTTSFYFDLLDHPAVLRLFPPPVPHLKPDATKGVHYFDSNAFRSERWYRSHFPTVVAREVVHRRTGTVPQVGEASPYYLFHPAAAGRARAMVPQSSIVVLLRDPVMRTYSHWKERRRNDAEPLSFPDALAAEEDRLAGERERLLADPSYLSYPWEQQSYATQSRYVESLAPWVELFGRENVHVTISEEYYQDPAGTLGDLHEFLGLPRHNTTTQRVRNAARGDDLDPTTRSRLAALFSSANHELGRMLGRDLPWS